MQHIDLVIFDADHTLYTPVSDQAYEEKFAFLAKETGVDADKLRRTWEAVVAKTEGTTDPGEWERKYLIEQTLDRVNAPIDTNVVEDAYSVFWETVAGDLETDMDIAHLLRQLKQAGYVLAVATDEFPEPLRIKLKAALDGQDMEDFFETIVTPHDTGTQKPSKQFYTQILDTLDVDPGSTVMVGDSWQRDLQPARALGMTTVIVGDDFDGSPDHRVQTLDELPALLLDDQ